MSKYGSLKSCHRDKKLFATLLRQKLPVLILIECFRSTRNLEQGPGFRAFFVRTRPSLSCDQKSTNYRHPTVFKQTTPYKQHGSEWRIVGVEVPCVSDLSKSCFVFQNVKKCVKHVRVHCVKLLTSVQRCNFHVRSDWFLTPRILVGKCYVDGLLFFSIIWLKMMERYFFIVGSQYGVHCGKTLNGQCIL